MKTLARLIFILAAFGGLNVFVAAQKAVIEGKSADPSAIEVEDVRIKRQGVHGLLGRIAFDYDVPIGLEIAPGEDELIVHNFYFEKGTLAELLDQFVDEHKLYTWKIKDGVVNVYPKDEYRDPLLKQLSEVEIDAFSIEKGTSCHELGIALAKIPSIKRLFEDNQTKHRKQDISGFYFMMLGRDFTLEAMNIKFGTLLNRVIKESPTATFWLVGRNDYDQSISINFSAWQEDSRFRPKIRMLRKADF